MLREMLAELLACVLEWDEEGDDELPQNYKVLDALFSTRRRRMRRRRREVASSAALHGTIEKRFRW
jgi:hypothetical protein